MNWTRDIDAAALRISPYTVRTPVVRFDGFGRDIAFKLEHLQHTATFKARGAFNTLLASDVPAAGIVAASGGNHGAAVAYAASRLGHKAKVFVPETSGPAKTALIRNAGADLVVVKGAYADAYEQALAYEAETGAMQIHAYDAPLTVAGQGTLMREWEQQELEADTILIAVGGGGLIGGAMAWLQGRRTLVAVETEGCATLHNALRDGVDTPTAASGIAANALGARTVGRICYDLAVDQNVQSVLVSDDDVTRAQIALWNGMRQYVEPAGATALAAILSGAYQPAPDERIAVLICGANPVDSPL